MRQPERAEGAPGRGRRPGERWPLAAGPVDVCAPCASVRRARIELVESFTAWPVRLLAAVAVQLVVGAGSAESHGRRAAWSEPREDPTCESEKGQPRAAVGTWEPQQASRVDYLHLDASLVTLARDGCPLLRTEPLSNERQQQQQHSQRNQRSASNCNDPVGSKNTSRRPQRPNTSTRLI